MQKRQARSLAPALSSQPILPWIKARPSSRDGADGRQQCAVSADIGPPTALGWAGVNAAMHHTICLPQASSPELSLLDKCKARNTFVKGFPLSFSIAALQVSKRALSNATAMSANLNCNNKHCLCLRRLCLQENTQQSPTSETNSARKGTPPSQQSVWKCKQWPCLSQTAWSTLCSQSQVQVSIWTLHQQQHCLQVTQSGLYLNCLQLCDGRPKRHSLFSIIHSTVQSCLSYSQSLRGDANPSSIQSLLRRTKYVLNNTWSKEYTHFHCCWELAVALLASHHKTSLLQPTASYAGIKNCRTDWILQRADGCKKQKGETVLPLTQGEGRRRGAKQWEQQNKEHLLWLGLEQTLQLEPWLTVQLLLLDEKKRGKLVSFPLYSPSLIHTIKQAFFILTSELGP